MYAPHQCILSACPKQLVVVVSTLEDQKCPIHLAICPLAFNDSHFISQSLNSQEGELVKNIIKQEVNGYGISENDYLLRTTNYLDTTP